MSYRVLDMAHHKRRDHFAYFSSLAYPYVGLTVNVDITNALERIRAERLPFFLSLCWCAARAANLVPEFRQRILDGAAVEFDRCRTSHTVALEDGTFCYCTLEAGLPLPDFLARGLRAQEEAKVRRSIAEDPAEVLDKFFVSSLPWISYTALVQPVPMPADSNPRISWGKYFTQGDRSLLPLSVLCHHALVDGIHIAAFYRELDGALEALAQARQ